MSNEPSRIEALPNEMLLTILSLFPVKSLLPMLLTSRQFHNLIVRILETRILQTATLQNHALVIDVSHPGTNTPYLFCQHLGIGTSTAITKTPLSPQPNQLSKSNSAAKSQSDSCTSALGRLADIYSHFRPTVLETRQMRPGGGLLLGRVSATQAGYARQEIHLEPHELFAQLCTYTNMVTVGNQRGLFQSAVSISKGVIRVWREWLAGRCKSSSESEMGEEEGLLWADSKRNVGLRMSVSENESQVNEDPNGDTSVTYTLQYEELVIRATQLLLMVEQSQDQEANYSRKTTIFAY